MKEALKLALDALEWCHGGEPCGTAEAITAIKAALAQPAQEPVAIVAEIHMSRYTIEFTNGDLPEGAKLYTIPQQRTWVGLTDEEIDYLYVEHRGDGGPTAICEQFAKAYEAYLKEKNT